MCEGTLSRYLRLESVRCRLCTVSRGQRVRGGLLRLQWSPGAHESLRSSASIMNLMMRISTALGVLGLVLSAPRLARAGGYDTPMLYTARHMGMGGTAIGYV